MAECYREFAEGGFGLVITEGTYTDKVFAQGDLHQPGLTDDAQAAAWHHVVEEVHAAGGKIVAQLMHAGALSQGNPHRTGTAGPSATVPKGAQMAHFRGAGPYRMPDEMAAAAIAEAVAGFAAASVRARGAGFDRVEVHGANGYLLDQFLTEGVNRRTDAYGGQAAARVRLMAETVRAVRAAAGPDFLVGVRVSQAKVNDHAHSWAGREDDARTIFPALAAGGADYIHTTEHEAWRPAFKDGGPTLAALAKKHSGLPVIANGGLHNPAAPPPCWTPGRRTWPHLPAAHWRNRTGRSACAADGPCWSLTAAHWNPWPTSPTRTRAAQAAAEPNRAGWQPLPLSVEQQRDLHPSTTGAEHGNRDSTWR